MAKVKNKVLNRKEKLLRCWHLATAMHADDIQNSDLAQVSHHCWNSHIWLISLEFLFDPFVSLDVDMYHDQ